PALLLRGAREAGRFLMVRFHDAGPFANAASLPRLGQTRSAMFRPLRANVKLCEAGKALLRRGGESAAEGSPTLPETLRLELDLIDVAVTVNLRRRTGRMRHKKSLPEAM
ncbi:hypothetical protein, partial [Mesorhizobium sp.]|uniref:hypothetical protein n=1 Tax=Mesorhizobium sp. TaxID=1871066 RepID=UPI00257F3FA9